MSALLLSFFADSGIAGCTGISTPVDGDISARGRGYLSPRPLISARTGPHPPRQKTCFPRPAVLMRTDIRWTAN